MVLKAFVTGIIGLPGDVFWNGHLMKCCDPANREFPFCLAWANHTWLGKWYAGRKDLKDQVLIEQTYPGLADATKHFYCLLEAFTDSRYITVDGKPLFYIYRSRQIPDVRRLTDCWRELAYKAGLKGLHLVGQNLQPQQIEAFGLDASCYFAWRLDSQKTRGTRCLINVAQRLRIRRLIRRPVIYSYKQILPLLLKKGPSPLNDYPTLIPNWDNTPRALSEGRVFHESTPELFRWHLQQAVQMVAHKPMQRRIIFVRSWNEWSEGNYLEPDTRYGRALLEVLRGEIGIDRGHWEPSAVREDRLVFGFQDG